MTSPVIDVRWQGAAGSPSLRQQLGQLLLQLKCLACPLWIRRVRSEIRGERVTLAGTPNLVKPDPNAQLCDFRSQTPLRITGLHSVQYIACAHVAVLAVDLDESRVHDVNAVNIDVWCYQGHRDAGLLRCGLYERSLAY